MTITNVYIAGTAIVSIGRKVYRKKVLKSEYNILARYLDVLRNNPHLESQLIGKIQALLIPRKKKELEAELEKVETAKKVLKKQVNKITHKVAGAELYKINRGKQLLDIHPWFAKVDGKYYFKPYLSVALPEELVERFAEGLYEYNNDPTEENRKLLKGLINFWLLSLMNPNPRSRSEGYKYISRNKLIVTPNGYLVTFRMIRKTSNKVVRKIGDKVEKIRGIINEAYQFLNTSGKRTEDYYIIEQSGAFSRVYKHKLKDYKTATVHGSVFELYSRINDLDFFETEEEYQVYTDNHTKTFKIILGEPVTMPRDKCDHDPKRACSRGLHVGTPNFISRETYGDIPVVCLVNPRDIVAVPYEDAHKMRVCRYLPFAKLENLDEIGKFATMQVYEHSFREYEEEELQEKLQEKMPYLVEYYLELETYSQLKAMEGAKEVSKKLKKVEDKLQKLKAKAMEELKSNQDLAHLTPDELALIIKQRKITIHKD